jgi:hypothetical protein
VKEKSEKGEKVKNEYFEKMIILNGKFQFIISSIDNNQNNIN